MKIRSMICSLFTAAAVMTLNINVSAENQVMIADASQPDEICGYVNIEPSTESDVYVKIIKYTPETNVDDKGYIVYDKIIEANSIHSSDIVIFPLEYNNLNFETKKYEGSYDILVGVNKYANSTDDRNIVYNKINIVVEDINYCGYETNCNINIKVTDEDLEEPVCVESGDSSNSIYDITFSLIDYIPGDANNDNVVNIRDAALIAKMLSQAKGNELPKSADYNGDGVVNVRDAAAIASSLVKGRI